MMTRFALLTTNIILVALTIGAAAQEIRSEVSVQATGLFTKDSVGKDWHSDTVSTHADNSAGLLVSYRYRLFRWLAAEGSYGLSRDNLQYSMKSGLHAGDAYMHQATGALVVSYPSSTRFRISPYVLAGGGEVVINPGADFSTYPLAKTQTRKAFLYGGGADIPLTKRISLRAEYRGLLYQSPDFGIIDIHTGDLVHTAQPSGGIVFRF